MMDQIEQQNTQSGSKVLKRTIQFVISILSIFSILSYSSRHPIFVNSFNGYFSIFSFHLVSYTIDRKYMFLLCNGILVFLARNFEFFTSSPIIVDFHDKLDTTNNIDDEFVMRNEEVLMVEEGHKASVKEEENGVLINEADEEKRVLIVEEQESKDQKQETQEEQEQQEEEEHEEQDKEEEEQEEEEEEQQEEEHEEQEEEEKGDREGEEANGVLSAEELDKRFDEFIKKMKEAIRVEAQQQLVVA